MKMIRNLITVVAVIYMTTAIHQTISTQIYKYMVDPKWLEIWDEFVWIWDVAK